MYIVDIHMILIEPRIWKLQYVLGEAYNYIKC